MELFSAYDAATFRKIGQQLIERLAQQIEAREQRILPRESPSEMLRFWQQALQQPALSWEGFIDALLQRSIHLHHPRYMGHQVAPPLPHLALLDLLSALLNNGMAVYEMGGSSSVLEKVVCQWMTEQLELPATAGGLLTSGGSLANLTALLAARQAKLGNWAKGTSEKPALMVSEAAHYCVDRAVKIMGWGEDGIIKVPADERFRMRHDLLPDYLAKAQAAGRRVIAVVGSACTTSTGSYDDLNAIADFCEKEDLWFHVDGAHGLAAGLSAKHKSLTQGVQRADSLIIDFHKMLLTPALSTLLLYKEERHAQGAFQQEAEYLWEDEESWYDLGKRTVECTKRMMSVKAFALIKFFGKDFMVSYVEQTYRQSQQMANYLTAQSDFELPLRPESNIICFRYRPSSDLSEAALDELNATIRRKIIQQGDFYIVQTRLKGRIYLRCTLMHPQTGAEEWRALVRAIRKQ